MTDHTAPMKSGIHITDAELKRILWLLRNSDLSLPQIATRFGLSRTTVALINRKYQIRVYSTRMSYEVKA